MTLGEDPFADPGIQRSVHVVQEQRPRAVLVESTDAKLGKPGEHILTGPGARSADDHDPLGQQPAGDEADDLHRGPVEPLRIVDDAYERLLLGDLGKERQRRERDEEPIRGVSRSEAEHGGDRFALRSGKALELVEHRRADLVEAAVGELELGLDANRAHDAPTPHPSGQIPQERALPDASLSTEHQRPGPAAERLRQQPIERCTLVMTTEQARRRTCPGLSVQSGLTALPTVEPRILRRIDSAQARSERLRYLRQSCPARFASTRCFRYAVAAADANRGARLWSRCASETIASASRAVSAAARSGW